MEIVGLIVITLLILKELYYFFDIDKIVNKQIGKKKICKYGCRCDDEKK